MVPIAFSRMSSRTSVEGGTVLRNDLCGENMEILNSTVAVIACGNLDVQLVVFVGHSLNSIHQCSSTNARLT